MTGIETFSYIREFGSQRKLSVVRPDTSGIMPDLAFETPTCFYRDSSFCSTRQGGSPNLAVAGPSISFCFDS